MTLLNAPQFNEKKENTQRNLLVGAGVTIAVATLLAVGGFLLGHGWFFMNLPAEHHVKVFFEAVQSHDYARAYGIWNNDPDWQQHPQKYDYTLQRFTEDFTTQSDWKAPVNSFSVGCSKRDASGTSVAITINGKSDLTLKYARADSTLSFFPYELKCGLGLSTSE